jgi:hypothetical protein
MTEPPASRFPPRRQSIRPKQAGEAVGDLNLRLVALREADQNELVDEFDR